MLDCSRDDIRDLLPDLVHDQLEPGERDRVQRHLAECGDCAAELELLRSLRSTAFAAPTIDVDRIAAAVRGSLREYPLATARSAVRDDDVLPIDSAIGPPGSTSRAARVRGDSHRSASRLVAGRIPRSWRIAAGIALVAAGVGVGGYTLTAGGSTAFHSSTRETALAGSGQTAPDAERAVGPDRSTAKTSAPTSTHAAPMVAAAVGTADSGVEASVTLAVPLISGDALNQLSESDMQALLQSVDDLEAMPDLEPHQLPLLASVMEGAL